MPIIINTPFKTSFLCGVPDSTGVSWVAGYGAPSINGAAFTNDNVNGESVYDSSISYNATVDSNKVYMEAVIDQITIDQTTDNVYIGFRDKDVVSNQPGTTGLQLRWRQASPAWWIGKHPASASSSITTNTTPPTQCDILGFAVDMALDRCYANVNGTWLVDAGTGGGDPAAGGNGWTISFNNDDMYLWMAARAGATIRAIPATNYLPTGFTPIT